MAGGKETPRQKMIGMMYLVLTALLALNVSKEVITAFVTINDKLDASTSIINSKIEDDLTTFEMKKMALIARDGSLEDYNRWKGKADDMRGATNELVSYLMGECNAMITEAEGVDWIAEKDENGNITQLKPLKDISVKDNYDVPTQLFIGSNPTKPAERGVQITAKIHAYRNRVTEAMGTYTDKSGKWAFDAPENKTNLSQALLTANPKDTSKIAHFYKSLTIPATLYDDGEEKEMPWVSVTFNHAPIVAAAAMFTSLKLDVNNAASIASEYMLSKIEEIPYYINKIEPMAFAQSGYINQGDSLNLKVLIAAYDSTEINAIRWGMDADTLPANWTETTGPIALNGTVAGEHRVKGTIGVRERGAIKWKPWSFDYTVGQPMGVISQPEFRVLYRGYANMIEATASGYPSDRISISTSSGCRAIKQNGKWKVEVDRGIRDATITIRGQKEDGSTVQIASNSFIVRSLPVPEIFLGGISSGQNPSRSNVNAQPRIQLKYDSSVLISGVTFRILSGTVTVDGISRTGKILPGGNLDDDAKSILRQSSGKTVTITCTYKDPAEETKRAYPLVFKTR